MALVLPPQKAKIVSVLSNGIIARGKETGAVGDQFIIIFAVAIIKGS